VDSPIAPSIGSALSTEEEISISDSAFEMVFNEKRAKDARAIWNTRMRSLVIANKVIDVVKN
jgi:hypothetical protein